MISKHKCYQRGFAYQVCQLDTLGWAICCTFGIIYPHMEHSVELV